MTWLITLHMQYKHGFKGAHWNRVPSCHSWWLLLSLPSSSPFSLPSKSAGWLSLSIFNQYSLITRFILDWLLLSQENCLSTFLQMIPHWMPYWYQIIISCLSWTQLHYVDKTVCRLDKSFEFPDICLCDWGSLQ